MFSDAYIEWKFKPKIPYISRLLSIDILGNSVIYNYNQEMVSIA